MPNMPINQIPAGFEVWEGVGDIDIANNGVNPLQIQVPQLVDPILWDEDNGMLDEPHPDGVGGLGQQIIEQDAGFDEHGNFIPKKKNYNLEKEDLTPEMKLVTPLQTIFQWADPMPNWKDDLKSDVDSFLKVFARHKFEPDFPLIGPIPAKYRDVKIGVEIELENMAAIGTVVKLLPDQGNFVTLVFERLWGRTIDNSLRNNGSEYITRLGMQAKHFPDALKVLQTWLQAYYPKNDPSGRCGVHVHLDVREFTAEQLLNLVMLYILFEGILYNLSGNRHKNIYCVPIRSSTSNIEDLFTIIHKPRQTTRKFYQIVSYYKKYMALNLLPIVKYGSVEFRHHHPTIDPKKLMSWLHILLNLHYAARQFKFEELKETIFELNTFSNYIAFAEAIFYPISLKVPNEALVDDMYEGSSFLKELYLISQGEQ